MELLCGAVVKPSSKSLLWARLESYQKKNTKVTKIKLQSIKSVEAFIMQSVIPSWQDIYQNEFQ
jgi:hypothetical protein